MLFSHPKCVPLTKFVYITCIRFEFFLIRKICENFFGFLSDNIGVYNSLSQSLIKNPIFKLLVQLWVLRTLEILSFWTIWIASSEFIQLFLLFDNPVYCCNGNVKRLCNVFWTKTCFDSFDDFFSLNEVQKVYFKFLTLWVFYHFTGIFSWWLDSVHFKWIGG